MRINNAQAQELLEALKKKERKLTSSSTKSLMRRGDNNSLLPEVREAKEELERCIGNTSQGDVQISNSQFRTIRRLLG
ncbi:hypothetical protein [Risungbinella massiliensis]|uniref:hypothetical protein n=1 Tax=Risungbinella massiliensis TaxID=1329796 RepID=UPI0011CB9877|nr:hypothetical protein [Risungbinella massiliensis]